MRRLKFVTRLKKGTEIDNWRSSIFKKLCIKAMLSVLCKNLMPSQNAKVEEPIYHHRDIFALEKGLSNKTRVVINTRDAQPVLQSPKRLPWGKKKKQKGPLNIPWISTVGVVLPKKKDRLILLQLPVAEQCNQERQLSGIQDR